MKDKTETSKSKKGTFLVNIEFCQNSTWQGYVIWAEKNKKEYFRSALELLKIVDQALENAGMEALNSEVLLEKKA